MGQQNYELQLPKDQEDLITGHLDLGDKNPNGDSISVNSQYIKFNDQPFFPVIGEFHYSRYPEKYWEESILKMKSGGINVIGSYVFWNNHERKEGVFDWSENLNLKKFIQLCKEHDMYVIVRLGPFCHGEMRNGGLPDWLYGKPFEVRSNNIQYLDHVNRLYGEISDQLSGMLYKDGGPVIGVQLENEFQHSAAPWEITYPGAKKERTVSARDAGVTHEQIAVTDGHNPYAEEGEQHMEILKNIAKKNGLEVPLYTATGWGNAAIVEKGSIPVTAGYVYPFWSDPHPSPFYLFKDIRQHPDYMPVSYDTKLYPSIAAEIGPGIQVKFSRRPFVHYESVEPLMVRTVGSGSNGIGYYMYHGGSTPVFESKFYNEDVSGMPKINYDFQAPIGQYGQLRPQYHTQKLLHMFLESYGNELAPMQTVLPLSNEKITPQDTKTLRFAARSKGDQGFLFMINFQDHMDFSTLHDLQVKIKTSNEEISFPSSGTFDLLKASTCILPFNVQFGDANFKSATVQPLTKLDEAGGQKHFVFYSIEGLAPEIVLSGKSKIKKLNRGQSNSFKGDTRITGRQGEIFSFEIGKNTYTIIPKELALQSYKIKDRLFFTNGLLLDGQENISIVSREEDNDLHIYPSIDQPVSISGASLKGRKSISQGFSTYTVQFEKVNPEIDIKKLNNMTWMATLSDNWEGLNDVFLHINYTGDRGMAFIDGLLVTDHFYNGRLWEIGLKSFKEKLNNENMIFKFHPIYKDYPYLGDLPEQDKEKVNSVGTYFEIGEMKVIPEYKANIQF
ncbi:beta-galactosidase [Echinicola jeungdonensis]